MRQILCAATLVGGVVCVGTNARAQYLLVPESTNDQVLLLNAFDGSVVNSSFLDIATPAAAAGVSSTPIEALQVGNEIWVSDQVADRIWRFDQNGGFIGDLGVGALDNIRGMEIVGDTVYVANAGTGGTSAPGIVTIDVPTLTITGSFAGLPADDISYWDVQLYNGELLVSNSDTGNDGIERYAFDGTFLGFFAQSDGVASFDMIEQLAVRSNNNVLGAGFTPPSGVYEFTPDGTSLGIVAGLDFGPRGVAELGNGSILWTNGSFLQTDSDLILDGLSFRYISQTTIPAPASILVLGGLLVRRRRR